ncbi:MAG: hypothetical protein ACKOYQ_10730, partial [Actinomycetota bacterium]
RGSDRRSPGMGRSPRAPWPIAAVPNYVQRVAALSSIVTTFNQDFADSKNGTPWAQIAAKPISALRAGAAPSGRTASERSWTQTFPVLCGALPTSDGPVPAPDW